MRRFLSLAALLMIASVPVAAAQTVADLSTSADPDRLVIDPRKHIQQDGMEPERQTFEVHVVGSIDCRPALQPPFDILVEASGSTAVNVTNGAGETYRVLWFEPTEFIVPWTSAGGGRYEVDHKQTITLYSDGAIPANTTEFEVAWESNQGSDPNNLNHRGVCDPEGFFWLADSTPHTIVPAATGPGDDMTGTDDPDESTPAPFLLPLLLIGGLVGRKRKRA